MQRDGRTDVRKVIVIFRNCFANAHYWCYVKVNVKQSHYRHGQAIRVQDVEAPRFLDNRHIKVVRLSALRTGRFYPPENTPGTHFC
jgi:hypothetical protein